MMARQQQAKMSSIQIGRQIYTRPMLLNVVQDLVDDESSVC